MKVKIYNYRVTGFAPFPVDMLRYDQAYPRHESESYKIVTGNLLTPHPEGVQVIELQGLRYPTEGRWESFGWSVAPEIGEVAIT